jgi:hypothetical protein
VYGHKYMHTVLLATGLALADADVTDTIVNPMLAPC